MGKTGSNAITSVAAACLVAAPIALAAHQARADELSDLKANQELLQRRLDQLAQTSGALMAPTGGGAVTTQMMGGSFPRSFLIPGTDTSIRVGGEIREIVDFWFNGGPPNTSPQTTTVGVNGQLQSIPLNIHIPLALGSNANAVGTARGNDVFSQSPKESKLSVETRTPTAWGEARTYMEFDWGGSTAFAPGGADPTSVSDNLVPRLRFAYGTLGGLLAGQANSNFSDPDANAEVIDFGGNTGEPGVVRIPQVRYTVPLTNWSLPGAISVSAEAPETDVASGAAGVFASDTGAIAAPTGPVAGAIISPSSTGLNAGTFVNPAKATAPDLTAAWYIPQPWGHVDFSAVIRPGMEINDGGLVNRDFIGYGAHFGGDVKPNWFGLPAKDDIAWHVIYGDGIGRYLNSSTNFAIVTNYPAAGAFTAASAAGVLARTTTEWGGEIGYQHWWADNLRSNVNAGINHHDINSYVAGCVGPSTAAPKATGAGGCGLNKELITAHANLIWNPVPFVDVGIEYMYGHRQVVSNLKGDENVLISKFGVKF
ncbi:MAG: porin [Alphaproteobacteria bacterium]|nr:porin [Alphaproteobacteria bacterium]